MADRNVNKPEAAVGADSSERLSGGNFKTFQDLCLMTGIDKPLSIETMSQVPMAPSASAMAAARAIRDAQAQQAQPSKASTGPSEKDKSEMLKRTIQVSNINPLIPANLLKEFFGVWGTIVDCTITDSNDFAYIKYSKPEQATAALNAKFIVLCGRFFNVEMAKSLPPSPEPLKLKTRS